MKERLDALVRDLCAPDLGRALALRLPDVINRYRDTIQAPDEEYDPQLPLDETDIFLIAHEHQFFGDSKKPAAHLHEFLTTQLEGVVKGVHVLSAGVSLEEMQELTRDYRVMVDVVMDQDQDYSDPEVVISLFEALLGYLVNGVSVVRLVTGARLVPSVRQGSTTEGGEHLSAEIQAVLQLSREVISELAPWSVLVADAVDDGAHMVPQYALSPLVLDAMLQANAEQLRCWARALPELPPTVTSFNVLASGGLVSRMRNSGGGISGEAHPDFLSAVTDPALPVQQRARVFLCAQAIMLSLAGVPGVGLHNLIGSETPETEPEVHDLSGGDRAWELEFGKLVEELESPGTLRNVVFEGYKALLRARALEPLCHPKVPQKILDLNPAVFALLRSTSQNNGEGMLCIHNLSLDPVELMFSPAEFGLDIEVGMREIIGGDIVFPSDEPGGLVSLEVDSYEVLWLRTPVHLDTDEDRSFLFEDEDFPVEAAELEDKED